MKKAVGFILLVVLLHAAEGDPVCNAGTDQCHQDRMMEILGALNRFPPEHFLTVHCNDFTETVNCILEEARECPNSVNKGALAEYEEIQRIVLAICDGNSAFRRTYVNSYTCYNTNLNKLSNCTSVIHRQVDQFMADDIKLTRPYQLQSLFKYHCIKMITERNCHIRMIADNCEVESIIPMKEILYGASNLLITTLCEKEYTPIWLDEFYSYVARSSCVTNTTPEQEQTTVKPEFNMRDTILGGSGNFREGVINVFRFSKENAARNVSNNRNSTTPSK